MTSQTIKLVAVGDIFLADSPLKVGRGVRASINEVGADHFVGKIRAIIQGHDICFGNLECCLSNSEYNKYKISCVEVRGGPEFVKILKQSGFNVLNVANNHIFQHGLNAYCDTVNHLINDDIKVVGDKYFGRNYQIININDISVAFVGYSMHYEQYRPAASCPYVLMEKYEEIIEDIKSIRSRFEGILVCSLHWGYEFVDSVSVEQISFCHELVESGVNLILGHHPHVVQGVEEYVGSLIAYSLGNFIFDMDFPDTRQSFAISIEISSAGVVSYNLIPFFIGNDCCPYLMDNCNSDIFLRKIAAMTQVIASGTCLSHDMMKNKEKAASSKAAKVSYIDFFKNIHRMDMVYSASLIFRALLRRIGILHNP